MASITVDGQSVSVDGRRTVVVSGTIHAARIARDQWSHRLRAASLAGLNTIEVPVPWCLHAPRQGVHDFDDNLDLARFIRLAGEHGLRVILRIGPYIGDGYDLGGIPSWLVPLTERKLRTASPEFLGACAAWFSQLASKLASLQATKRVSGLGAGPIVLIQCEHEWMCADDADAAAYLGELGRLLREVGFTVPLVARNNLFVSVEGQIDAWTTADQPHALVRQLAAVRPNQPRMLLGVRTGAHHFWGTPAPAPMPPEALITRLAEIIVSGGQFNIAPFADGSAFGFSGARSIAAPDAFSTTCRDDDGPMSQAGRAGPLFSAVKRIATFATSFERVLAALDPTFLPVVLAPQAIAAAPARTGRRSKGASADDHALSILHGSGTGGGVVAIVHAHHGHESERHLARLTMPNGSIVEVDLTGLPVALLPINTHLAARATLDYTTLSVFALVGSTLVCYGPAGAKGVVSINGAPLDVEVPKTSAPHIVVHEEITIIVGTPDLIDASFRTKDAIVLGASFIDAEGHAEPHPAFPTCTIVSATGEASTIDSKVPRVPPARAQFTEWARADQSAYAEGTADRFAGIDDPISLEQLGCAFGYGWMRAVLKAPLAKAGKIAAFQAADRVHFYADGVLTDVIGRGPGAAHYVSSSMLKKGVRTIVALVDNLGRFDAGNAMGQPKGLFGHLFEVAPIKVPVPTLERAEPMNPLDFHRPVFGLLHGERTSPQRIAWTFLHRKSTPILIELAPPPAFATVGLIVLNGHTIGLLSPGQDVHLVAPAEALLRGKNTLEIAIVGDHDRAFAMLKGAATFWEGVRNITETAQWAFARWEPPTDRAFRAVTKADLPAKGGPTTGHPAWWRGTFTVAHTRNPLFFDATGLSKGQLFLNGRNLGRYFIATHEGTPVPPQSRYYLPESWITPGEPNTLTIFDEHGFAPGACKLVIEK